MAEAGVAQLVGVEARAVPVVVVVQARAPAVAVGVAVGSLAVLVPVAESVAGVVDVAVEIGRAHV